MCLMVMQPVQVVSTLWTDLDSGLDGGVSKASRKLAVISSHLHTGPDNALVLTVAKAAGARGGR